MHRQQLYLFFLALRLADLVPWDVGHSELGLVAAREGHSLDLDKVRLSAPDQLSVAFDLGASWSGISTCDRIRLGNCNRVLFAEADHEISS